MAVGNIHGAISGAASDQKKPEARINLEHLGKLNGALGVPLVLHGGSGINLDYVRKAAGLGISKMNIGTDLRQVFERELKKSGNVDDARDALYSRCRVIFTEELKVAGSAQKVAG